MHCILCHRKQHGCPKQGSIAVFVIVVCQFDREDHNEITMKKEVFRMGKVFIVFLGVFKFAIFLCTK